MKNRAFFDRMEALRIKAAALMGMGDVSKSVTPKFGLIAPAKGRRNRLPPGISCRGKPTPALR